MKALLKEYDDFDSLDASELKTSLKLIGGAKMSYSKKDVNSAVASLLIMEYPSMKIIYEDHHSDEQSEFPSIPGFAGFKEAPLY